MNMIKVMLWRFEQGLGTFTMLLVKWSYETGHFRHLSNHIFGVRNFGNTKPMRVILLFKTFEISNRFPKWTKNWEKVFCFCDNCIWIGIVKFFLWRTRYISSPANVLTSSPKIFHVNKRDLFQLSFLWQWSMNMKKVPLCWFQQCFGRFTMLLAEGFSEMGLFRHLSNHVFSVRNLGNTKAVRVISFFKMVKI